MQNSKSPGLTRFLSDFTLGFSDGLTVPFALTAGLSSLGRADTVIYAGLAELCAGSISMGIGGYLSALDEVPPPAARDSDRLGNNGDEEESRGMLHDGSYRGSTSDVGDIENEKDGGGLDQGMEQGMRESVIRSHLEPLALPNTTVLEIIEAVNSQRGGVGCAVRRLQQQQREIVAADPQDQLPIWPVASGLSISLGYVVGGIIPLFPYFFAATVGRALLWSIALCLVALMAFGSGKSWLLRGEDRSLKRSLWEGSQMLILGSLAAGAAVLCVNLVGGGSESGH